MSEFWQARRTNFEECREQGDGDNWGWWQIYVKDRYGRQVVMNFNLATESDEVPEIVQECLDAHNAKLGEKNAKEEKRRRWGDGIISRGSI